MSNFKCDKCGMINIDCEKEGFKTPREMKLEECIIQLKEQLKLEEDWHKSSDKITHINHEYTRKLQRKLEIAEEALKYYANSKMPDDLYTSEKINGSAISTDNWAIRGEFNQCKYKVYYDNENAQQALQRMKEVDNG